MLESKLIDSSKANVREVELLVDTGAFYTVLPSSLAKEFGIVTQLTTELTLADKRIVKAGISLVYMKLLDREGVLPVVILDTPEVLLGTTALEGLGLKVDSSTGKLERSRSFGLGALSNLKHDIV
ncbi:MAG: aspartyl protease family protein [archaeon]|nr:aspartyl protease family protein [archaeon]MCP8320282.1 aspartyl protease family protein [archaeon]